MTGGQDLDAEYQSAVREYAVASSRYELAVMSGDRAERSDAQRELELAGKRYALTMAAAVPSHPRPAFEDVLTEAWAQPDTTSMILASIVAYDAASLAAGRVVREGVVLASSLTRSWTNLAGLLSGATVATAARIVPATASA